MLTTQTILSLAWNWSLTFQQVVMTFYPLLDHLVFHSTRDCARQVYSPISPSPLVNHRLILGIGMQWRLLRKDLSLGEKFWLVIEQLLGMHIFFGLSMHVLLIILIKRFLDHLLLVIQVLVPMLLGNIKQLRQLIISLQYDQSVWTVEKKIVA